MVQQLFVFIYLILKVIRVTGYQVGIFPGTYRYLRGQKNSETGLLLQLVISIIRKADNEVGHFCQHI